ncbi:BTAD domain-containing putative transcriptional regulator [Microbacterium thalassium]|uniref:DNA-binding SARP family transcriptional activator n=1 Tax=Microbacterium thalassium TaxID=362649 RepID=A0A7X0FRL0_9MICO|nr:BTAD domain-containing putative transcriptional regulator [Microbacterium thalassium]MBB6391781.1 DNA-binding SARP family transcriptional activator [Microbacterium thalassium]
MSIDVLGPMRVETARLYPRELAVLAALVVRDGQPITAQELAEVVWPDTEPPATWNKQVQAAIARLRKTLGAGRIVTTAVGYHLDIDPEEIDARRFESLVSRARDLHRADEPDRAAAAFGKALELWRGRPYEEISAWPEAAAAASDLEHVRVEATEAMLRARLDAGDAAGVIPDAERLVRDEPLRESRWTLLALSCYRAGRQADALAVLRSARERLADELGVDAGHELRQLEAAILQQDDSLDTGPSATPTRADCPYRGLGTYQEGDAGDYFGREDEIATAARRLDATGLLIVTGASGSGKSSLVRAGVVPSLRRRGRRVLVLGPDPAIAETLRSAIEARTSTDAVVVDQFEEVLEGGAAVGAQVAAMLAAFVRDGGKAIVTVRSDFLDRCAADPSLGPLMSESVLVVSPLGDDDLRRVVEEPAARAGLRLEPGLVELMLRDAAGATGVLPHLSHALAETWVRREGRVLTVAGYEATGGIDGAIAQSADRLYAGLDTADQELCRSTLLRLVALAPDGLPVRRRLLTAPLRDDPAHARLFGQLAHARLLSVEGDSVVLAHESLTRAWPRFRTWVQDGAEDLTVLGHLETGAQAWDEGGRHDDDLARGVRLQAMLDLRERIDPSLTPTEVAFVEASAAHEKDEKRALAEAAAAERRQNRRLRLAIAGVAVVAVVAIVTGGLAVRSAVGEAAAAESARIDALANETRALRDTDRTVAALLAAEAYRRWPDDARARGMLLGLLGSDAGAVESVFIPDTEQRVGGAILPGNETALIVRDEQYVDVRDVRTGGLIRSLDIALPPSGSPRRPFVTVTPDGKTAVITDDAEISAEGEYGSVLSVIDLESGSMPFAPLTLERSLGNYALSPAGNYAAYIDDFEGDLVVIDLRNGEVRTRESVAPGWNGTGDWQGSIAFVDGMMVAGMIDDRLITLDPNTLDIVDSRPAPGMYISTRLLPLDDGGFVAVGHLGIVRLDAEGGIVWQQDEVYGIPCIYPAVAEDTGRLYCGDVDGLIEERDLETGERTGLRLDYQLGATGELTVTDDDELLIMSAVSPSIGRWQLSGTPRSVTEVEVPGYSVTGFDPSGQYLLIEPEGAPLPDIRYEVRDALTNETVHEFTASVAYWVGSGIIRTVTGDRENYYIDVAAGTEVPADLHDHQRSEPYTWAEPRTSRDGTVFYDMACCSGEVEAMDPSSHEPIDVSFQIAGPGYDAATNEDGSRVAFLSSNDDPDAVSGSWVGVFDASTGEQLAESSPPDAAAIAMTSDARVIVGGYGSLVVMDERLEPLEVLPAPAGELYQLALSADDSIMVAGTRDPAVAVYDLEAGRLLGDPIPAIHSLTGVVVDLDPSGDSMLVSMPAGVVRWSLDPDVWFEQVCRIAGRNLTQAEWDTHLSPVGEYRETCTFPTE